ncbi:hypothetical protein PAAG_12669 [Paracoccidioides lutzii Pb01]|uniref:Uncharacterized protein n=1 Tax=Paracoccidioides lutzii (strain ATCC MYA-826 / Pb01) TaxID=502779 RepID=A0A0A2VIG0_PARBA|nr:hypothetical protein PAAG_12669 [Paracoccidioides lutzii Pb01]KGQ00669.1 hypothetical protein PAAG_12669 [Paracoccidioides lutzii Pb01]
MRRPGGLASKPFILFVLFFFLLLLTSQVAAQQTTNEPSDDSRPDNTRTENPNPDNTGANSPRPEGTTNAPNSNPTPVSTTEGSTGPSTGPSTEASTEVNTPPQTETPKDTEAVVLPTISSEASSTTSSSNPTETNTSDLSSMSMPPLFPTPTPQVPPSEGAPYLHRSNLPENTIFIAVGTALGVFGVAVFAWRALVAWSINRSVRRAAIRPNNTDATALLNKRKSGIYRQPPGAAMSMEKFGHQPQGYSRTRSSAPSPPASPSLAPTSRGHEQGYPSTSSINLSAAAQARAPSAYLEDLFENHNPPGR